MLSFIVHVKVISPAGSYAIEELAVQAPGEWLAEEYAARELDADETVYEYEIIGAKLI